MLNTGAYQQRMNKIKLNDVNKMKGYGADSNDAESSMHGKTEDSS